MKKNNTLFVLILLLIAVCSVSAYQFTRSRFSASEPSFSLNQITDHSTVAAEIAGKSLNIEVVNTPASITQGLSGRERLGADGMLFLLPTKSIPSFWMKEMRFDLDLVWLDDSTVVEIAPHVPRPLGDVNPNGYQYLPTYSPKTPVNMVLELEAGKAAALGLKSGDKLILTK